MLNLLRYTSPGIFRYVRGHTLVMSQSSSTAERAARSGWSMSTGGRSCT